jgi:hypothetical protein
MNAIQTGVFHLVLVAVVATGCTDTNLSDTDNGVVQPSAGHSSDETFTRTAIMLGSDGHRQLSVKTITRAELERQKESRARAPSLGLGFALVAQAHAQSSDLTSALVDASCEDPRSMWLFDKPNLSGNVICLIRDLGAKIGFDALDWFTRTFKSKKESSLLSEIGSSQQATSYGNLSLLHWGGAVRSFWAGSDPGYFRLHFSPFTVERFMADQRADSVSQTVADAYVLALTRPGATREVTFTGWRFGLVRCAAPRVDPGSSFSISDGQEGHIETHIPGTGVPRSDGLLDCSYSTSWPLRYGVTYDIGMAGGSCRLMVLEDSIVKPSGLVEPHWWRVGQIHFYDGTCWNSPPV